MFFPRSTGARENAKNDPYALTAWCLKILAIANTESLPVKYNAGSIDDAFLRDIARLSYFENGPQLAKEYLGKQGIHLVTLTHLSKTYLDGAVIFPPGQNPVIGLTLRYDRIDNFWFCLLHELVHLSKHTGLDNQGLIVDDLDLRKYGDKKENDIEQEADETGEGSVNSRPGVGSNVDGQKRTSGTMSNTELAEKIKIHPAIIAEE